MPRRGYSGQTQLCLRSSRVCPGSGCGSRTAFNRAAHRGAGTMSEYALNLKALRIRPAAAAVGRRHPSVLLAVLSLAATAVWAPRPTAAATGTTQPAETLTATVHDLGLGADSRANAVDGPSSSAWRPVALAVPRSPGTSAGPVRGCAT